MLRKAYLPHAIHTKLLTKYFKKLELEISCHYNINVCEEVNACIRGRRFIGLLVRLADSQRKRHLLNDADVKC